MRRLFKTNTLLCFSPPVMIATFVIEIALIFRLMHVYRMNKVLHLAILMLFSLAAFQLAEYGVCEQIGFHGDTWAKIGFSAITLLPPVGLHLTYAIADKKSRYVLPISYVLAAAWIGLFIFSGIMEGQVCHGNYVIFEIKDPAELMYYAYYNSFLVIAIARAWLFIKLVKKHAQKRALQLLILGYLSFIIPSIIVRLLFEFNESTSSALPSIMCGFAVMLAAITSLAVVPKVAKPKHAKS